MRMSSVAAPNVTRMTITPKSQKDGNRRYDPKMTHEPTSPARIERKFDCSHLIANRKKDSKSSNAKSVMKIREGPGIPPEVEMRYQTTTPITRARKTEGRLTLFGSRRFNSSFV